MKILLVVLLLCSLVSVSSATMLIYERSSGRIVYLSTTAENARMKLERFVIPQRYNASGDTVYISRADSGLYQMPGLVVRYFDYDAAAPLYGLIDVRDQAAAVRVVQDTLARVFYGTRPHDIMLSDSTVIEIDGEKADTLPLP